MTGGSHSNTFVIVRNDVAAGEMSDVARRRRAARRRTIAVVGVAVMLPILAIFAGPSGGEGAPEIAANQTVAFTNPGDDQRATVGAEVSAELHDRSARPGRVNVDLGPPSIEPASRDLAIGSAPSLEATPARSTTVSPRSAASPEPAPTSTFDSPAPTSPVEGVVSDVVVANVAALPAAPASPLETTTSSTAQPETVVSTQVEPTNSAPPETVAIPEPPVAEPPVAEPPVVEPPAVPDEPVAIDPIPPVEPVEAEALSAREQKELEREQKKEERDQAKADRFDG